MICNIVVFRKTNRTLSRTKYEIAAYIWRIELHVVLNTDNLSLHGTESDKRVNPFLTHSYWYFKTRTYMVTFFSLNTFVLNAV